MKKIMVVVFALLFASNCFCQDLTFLGIPIKGSKGDFTKELLNKGFRLIPDDEEESLHGLFYGEQSIIKPYANEKGEMVNVTVILMSDESWGALYVNYVSMKMKLMRELGTPTSDDASFDLPVEPKSDIAKYQAVNNDKCKYRCFWFDLKANGGVAIEIGHLKSGENCVLITYLKMDENSTLVPHLKFKGISLGETPHDFITALKKQGYKYITEFNGTCVLSGSFAGYSDCRIFINKAQYENQVHYVAISFPNQTKWEYLNKTYSNLKDMLTRKYGEPASCTEKFNSSSMPTSENKIMSLLREDEFEYKTIYYVEGGYVELDISHIYDNHEHSFYVSLVYLDKANSESTNRRAIDDL
ncbi:MAG: hypothetical protein K6D59_00430 [Bacteroidales bacterium]|nr:hypothetical protein [Bacteroidales bacterium]